MATQRTERIPIAIRLKNYGLEDRASQLEDLRLVPGQHLKLMPDHPQASRNVVNLQPKSIKDLKRWFGVPDEAVERPDRPSFTRVQASNGRAFRSLPNAERRDIRAALHGFVFEHSAHVHESAVGAIDTWLPTIVQSASVYSYSDIYLSTGSTLQLDDSSVLFARHITVEQGASILISGGGAKIDCATLVTNAPIQSAPKHLYAGIWVGGADGNYFQSGMDFNTFEADREGQLKKGLHLVNVKTYVEQGQRLWAGVWRSGVGENSLIVDLTLDKLVSKGNKKLKKGQQLINVESYIENGERRWAGVWRSGSGANFFSLPSDINTFLKHGNDNFKKNLRLIDIETLVENGQRLWAGVWVEGHDANLFSHDLDFQSFIALGKKRLEQGLQLVSLRTYVDQGKRRWAGVWRSGSGPNLLTSDVNYSGFVAKGAENFKKGLRLINIEIYEKD